ncbi:MAG: substrate-binding domain-containing protein, partial [Actinobacteria bacterium]|nr:substrate-binding domain-containing protein [Actinomycetota bacterium]
LVNTDNDYEIQNSSLDMLITRGIDGIIISGIAGGKKDTFFINKIISNNIPVVLIDRYIPELNFSHVITNNFKAAYDATKYLISLGHSKISVISSPQKIKIFQDRLKGYKSALKEHGIAFREELIVEGEESIQSGYLTTKTIFEREGNFTAIFAMCDFMAFGAYQYCRENKILIPDDISIIGMDDIYTSSLLTPPLTTMAQKKYDMGLIATKIIIDSIKKNKLPNKQVVLEAKLLERNSCKKL